MWCKEDKKMKKKNEYNNNINSNRHGINHRARQIAPERNWPTPPVSLLFYYYYYRFVYAQTQRCIARNGGILGGWRDGKVVMKCMCELDRMPHTVPVPVPHTTPKHAEWAIFCVASRAGSFLTGRYFICSRFFLFNAIRCGVAIWNDIFICGAQT